VQCGWCSNVDAAGEVQRCRCSSRDDFATRALPCCAGHLPLVPTLPVRVSSVRGVCYRYLSCVCAVAVRTHLPGVWRARDEVARVVLVLSQRARSTVCVQQRFRCCALRKLYRYSVPQVMLQPRCGSRFGDGFDSVPGEGNSTVAVAASGVGFVPALVVVCCLSCLGTIALHAALRC
jgi:hypothetical protein